MQRPDLLLADIADAVSRLSLWPPERLSSRCGDLDRLHRILELIEREILDASAPGPDVIHPV